MCYRKQHVKSQLKDVCSVRCSVCSVRCLCSQISIKNDSKKFPTLSKRFSNFDFTMVKDDSERNTKKRGVKKSYLCDKACQF